MTNTDTTTRREQITIQLANSNCPIVIAKNLAMTNQLKLGVRCELFTPMYRVSLESLENISAPESRKSLKNTLNLVMVPTVQMKLESGSEWA